MVAPRPIAFDAEQPTPHGSWLEFEEDGTPIRFWIRQNADSIQSAIWAGRSFYEAKLLRRIRPAIPPLARIIDVGANIGNHAIFFAKLCGASQVIPFEPNPDVLPELLANLHANGCTNVDTGHLGVGLGAVASQASLRLDPQDAAKANRGGMRLDTGMTGSIEVDRLDARVTGRVDLIKIDVEGMALAVLEGAEGLVEGCRPDILVEVWLDEMPGLTDWLLRHDYRVSFADADYVGLTNLFLQPRPRPALPGSVRRIVDLVRRRPVAAPVPAPVSAQASPAEAEPVQGESPEQSAEAVAPASNVMEFKARAMAPFLGKPPSEVGEALYAQLGQEEAMMVDLLPIIQALYVGRPREPAVRVLDVGPRYCAGSDLLARVLHPWSYASFTVSVEAVDLDSWYAGPLSAIAPNVSHRVADIREIPGEGGWDLVIASHVIEHVPDPISFATELRRLAGDYVLVACPWKEKDLIEGHFNRMDEALLERLAPSHVRIYEAANWKPGESCVIMLFPRRPLAPETERRLADAGMVRRGAGP
ncbi:class I SAM-dependent methyltransferase [Falsiroseomonas oryzae]|uniref:class I SAM-dependent methyltransferase n=1 Tax=Falsiroseomonas oryzae TaxID=2766473 RepID=UPI0022EA9BCD|nr:FkbM family methyltransferase [Roseomonas sp. MO-31]